VLCGQYRGFVTVRLLYLIFVTPGRVDGAARTFSRV
jgi:hypothetical protein